MRTHLIFDPQVRLAGSDIAAYGTIMERAIAPIREAAEGLDTIVGQLIDLKQATEVGIHTYNNHI
jgi:hypothetical protein